MGQETVQYVIQQFICNFAFINTFDDAFDVMPNEEFIFYLIELMSDKRSNDNDQKQIDEENEEEEYGKFVADSYTKQEIASKILKLISTNDDNEILRILSKLNDALDNSQLLSSVLLRAAESEQHSKW